MTYEQAGGGSAGLVYRRRNGTLLTLQERLHTITMLLAWRRRIVRHKIESNC